MTGTPKGRKQTSRHRSAALLSVLAVACVGLGIWSISNGLDPRTRPMNHNTAVGSIINADLQVDMEDTVMCACFEGPFQQQQKKVKLTITNSTGDEWLDLRGGPDGSVYLYVAYPSDFTPHMTIPTDHGRGQRMLGSSPASKWITVTSDTQSIDPDKVDPVVAEQLGIDDGWTAWALPANPNALTLWLSDSRTTFPTWVDQDWLAPGKTYRGDGNGVGAWVFFIPVQDEIASVTSPYVLQSMLTSEFLDPYYRVLGVAVRDRNGATIGFAPVPPESSYSSATEF